MSDLKFLEGKIKPGSKCFRVKNKKTGLYLKGSQTELQREKKKKLIYHNRLTMPAYYNPSQRNKDKVNWSADGYVWVKKVAVLNNIAIALERDKDLEPEDLVIEEYFVQKTESEADEGFFKSANNYRRILKKLGQRNTNQFMKLLEGGSFEDYPHVLAFKTIGLKRWENLLEHAQASGERYVESRPFIAFKKPDVIPLLILQSSNQRDKVLILDLAGEDKIDV